MNALTYARRIDAIIANLANNTEMEDSAAGVRITIWKRNGKLFCALSNDTAALMGAAFTGSAFDVRNEVLRLAGF